MSAVAQSLKGDSNANDDPGKVTVITGSSCCIGAAIVKHMGEQGAKVVVNYVNDAKAAEEVVSAVQATNSGSAVPEEQRLIDETVKAFAGGRIIFFSLGITASSSVAPATLVYTASKAAIEQISRILAKDLDTKGITVNTISLGPVDTLLFREGKPLCCSVCKKNQFIFLCRAPLMSRLGRPVSYL
ncbi:hypothetical protein DFH09DRAFT_1255062 [Mycena vulgaris]|nr:hypothetical protein DFH09DRAFT_1255062 [Mycena vulgaris]